MTIDSEKVNGVCGKLKKVCRGRVKISLDLEIYESFDSQFKARGTTEEKWLNDSIKAFWAGGETLRDAMNDKSEEITDAILRACAA